MRTLKFRAFTREGKMINNVTPFTWDFCIGLMWHKCIASNGIGVLGSGGTEATFEVGGFSIVDGHLMQFTGLHDKNKKEIYGGDIVSIKYDARTEDDDGTPLNYGASIGFVDWDDHSTGWILRVKSVMSVVPEGTVMTSLIHGRNGEREVIGNIHQNPELL